ncbi:COG4705 family protein [Nocardia stercoris]|uniref:Membrane-anchored protein n=1 Tax=Nocardia stercoris TaxID=2483361 RepID=A0A3M2L3X4_9NOCA|nr:hypothetical protein [Nocardia stercoris]RMI30565.1 hypothetical protein EBN03_21040 [Nocardia stercoris]
MSRPTGSAHTSYKLPQITVLFWVLKIAATTLGETGGDWVAQTLDLGYLDATLLFFAVLIVVLIGQLRARNFHPALYWTLIAATSTMGTTLSDLLNRGDQSGSAENGLGYPAGAAILISALAVVFVIWKFTGETYDVAHITTTRGELLYWAAIVLSNTLGTSTGDFLSDSSGLGYWGGAAVIATAMAAILLAHYFTPISGVFLFWTAFVLTRPLGATVGDFLWKPHAKGGLGLGSGGTSAVILAILIAGIAYSIREHRRNTVHANTVQPESDALAPR